jgi:hypothetical protein
MNLKMRTTMLTLAVCLAAVAIASAANANMGTWKLNDAKSKIPAGVGKNNMVMYVAAGDSIKVTIDGEDGKGAAFHSEWTGKFDNKDYALTGDPSADMRAYKEVNDHSIEATTKKDGKVTSVAKIVVAADGKTRTLSVSATDAMGKKIKYESLYDKQ